MQRILICEDQKPILDKIETIAQNYVMIENLAMEVTLACVNPEELLHAVKENLHIGDLYFLDIDLKHKLSGMILAQKIRKLDPEAKIVFITTHAELAMLTFQFQIEALDFIIKDESEQLKQRIISCIQTAHERYLHHPLTNENYFTVEIHNRIEKFAYNEIIFITTAKTAHKLSIHTINRVVEFYGEFQDAVDEKKGLVRCHRSYIVNLNHVVSFDIPARRLYMQNGELCPVSIRYKNDIKSKLRKFVK